MRTSLTLHYGSRSDGSLWMTVVMTVAHKQGDVGFIIDAKDACRDRGITFRLKWYPNDGAP